MATRGAARLSASLTPDGQAAFDAVWSADAAAVKRHLVYLTGDPALAEDLAQETFARLFARQASGEPMPDNPRAWLLRVASNLAYNEFRGTSRRAAREQAAPYAGEETDLDDVLDVRRALGSLEARDRLVLLLRHSGFSYAEIAATIEVAPGSVGTILVRAQRRFRDIYTGGPAADEKE